MPSPALHILTVDDEPEIGELLSALFADRGHKTSVCYSGAEALQKLHTSGTRFDLLITDQQMPGSVLGIDLVRIARARGFRGAVLVGSGSLTPELIEDYKRFSVAFIHKPFDLKRIRALVDGFTLLAERNAAAERVLN